MKKKQQNCMRFRIKVPSLDTIGAHLWHKSKRSLVAQLGARAQFRICFKLDSDKCFSLNQTMLSIKLSQKMFNIKLPRDN